MPVAPFPVNENERLDALYRLRLMGTPAEERFDRITRLAQKTFGVPVAIIDLVDSTRAWLKSVQGLYHLEVTRPESYCQFTILHPEPCIIPDALTDPRLFDNPYAKDLRFYAGVPIKAEGQLVGVFCICDFEPRILRDEQISILLDFAEMAEREINVARLSEAQTSLAEENERLTQKACVDSLTKLWNRGATMDLLARELATARIQKQPLGVMMLDVDRFKSVNDTYGHPVGDMVLLGVADRMRGCVRPGDTVGRLGGEEFLVILPGCNQETLLTVAERLREAVAGDPIVHKAIEIPVTVSIGVSMAFGMGCSDATLLKAADLGLYVAKNSGRNRVESRWLTPSLYSGLPPPAHIPPDEEKH